MVDVTAALATTETQDVAAFIMRATFPSTVQTLVQFTDSCTTPRGCYAVGDIAGFPYWFAQLLIKSGEAALYDAGDGAGYVL